MLRLIVDGETIHVMQDEAPQEATGLDEAPS
jgi:hypothetical protein